MSDTTNYPFIPTKSLTEGLPTLMMLLYGAVRHGAVVIDKQNQTISIDKFPYDVALVEHYIQEAQHAIDDYAQRCQNLDTSGNPNELLMLNEIHNILLETKQWLQ